MSNPELAAIVKRAEQFYNDGRYDVAASAYSQALQMTPRDNRLQSQLYTLRARCYGSAEEPNRALADANKAIQLDRSNGMAFYTRGLIYAGLDKFKEAQDNLQQAKQLGIDVDDELETFREARRQQMLGWGVLGAQIVGGTIWNSVRQSWKEYGPK